MDFMIPEWASKHAYGWHSNYKIKTKSKIFFEKCYVRPLLDDAWKIVNSDKATAAQKAECYEYINILDNKYNDSDNAAMMTGRVVQAICDMVLLDSLDISEAIANGMEKAMAYTPNKWEKNDAAHKDRAIQDIPDIAKNAVIGLREAMPKVNRVIGETDLYNKLPGNKLPYFTKPDYALCGDLKVKTYRVADTKSGFRRPSLPTSLNGMFEKNNASQVAGFWALNGFKPPWLLYVSKDDYKLLTNKNCDQLQDEFLGQLMAESIAKNKAIEHKLQRAETIKDLLADEFPDFHEWRQPPKYIKHAEELWRSYDD